VKEVMYGAIEKGRVVVRDVSGHRVEGSLRSSNVVVLSRADYDLYCIDRVSGAAARRAAACRARVASLYPGELESVEIEARRGRRGRPAVIMLMRRDKLIEYRAVAGKAGLCAFYQLLETKIPQGFCGVAVQWASGHIEVLRFDGGRLAESLIAARCGSPDDGRRVLRLVNSLSRGTGNGEPIYLIAPAGEIEEVTPFAAARPVVPLPIESFATFPMLECWFRVRTPPRQLLRELLAPALLLVVAAGALAAYRQSHLPPPHFGQTTEAERPGEIGIGAGTDAITALEREYSQLEEERPVDLYSLLAELAHSLDRSARVDELTLAGDSFELHLQGGSAIDASRRLSKNEHLRDVALVEAQYYPERAAARPEETFLIKGRYR